VQKPELQQDQEQAHDHRTVGAEKVLPVLPETSRAPRDEVTKGSGLAVADKLTPARISDSLKQGYRILSAKGDWCPFCAVKENQAQRAIGARFAR
jgi:hypothetical protein